jgi:hypothetical protein
MVIGPDGESQQPHAIKFTPKVACNEDNKNRFSTYKKTGPGLTGPAQNKTHTNKKNA